MNSELFSTLASIVLGVVVLIPFVLLAIDFARQDRELGKRQNR